MKKPHIPQSEFSFAADTFNLHNQDTFDGDRLAREQKQREADREAAQARQTEIPETQSTPVVIHRQLGKHHKFFTTGLGWTNDLAKARVFRSITEAERFIIGHDEAIPLNVATMLTGQKRKP